MDKNKWQRLINYSLDDEYNKVKIIQDNEKIINIYEDKYRDINLKFPYINILNEDKFHSKESFFKKNKLFLILILITSILALLFFVLFLYFIINNKDRDNNNDDDKNYNHNNDNIILIYKTNTLNEEIHLLSDKNENKNH